MPVALPRSLYVQGAGSAAQASSSARRGGKGTWLRHVWLGL